MTKYKYKVIGVMSGTSLDGIDLACIHFHFDTRWTFELVKMETLGYSESWVDILKNLVSYSSGALKAIDVEYTSYLSEVINNFIKRNSLTDIDAICSHGHTALHDPNKGLTYQIGNQKALATLTKNKVVCDFRVQDVVLQGQGAPLVPIGDALLFPEFDYCINLGGFANISFEEKSQRVAFDICPVNIVLNHYMQKIGLPFDDKGKMARTGKVNKALLEKLNKLSFYALKSPKSLGIEWVKKEIFPLLDLHKMTTEDRLCTFVEHIAIQISSVMQIKEKTSVLITGGGAFNTFLISRIKALSLKKKIIIPSSDIINYKEALVFGLLGILKIRNEVNCLSSVTGALHDHSSGRIYLP